MGTLALVILALSVEEMEILLTHRQRMGAEMEDQVRAVTEIPLMHRQRMGAEMEEIPTLPVVGAEGYQIIVLQAIHRFW
jgi:hypothetical protein